MRSHWHMKMIFYSHANETHFHKKDFSLFPLGRFLKVTVFGTQKWQGSFLRNLFAHDTNGWSLEMSTSVKKNEKWYSFGETDSGTKRFLGQTLHLWCQCSRHQGEKLVVLKALIHGLFYLQDWWSEYGRVYLSVLRCDILDKKKCEISILWWI